MDGVRVWRLPLASPAFAFSSLSHGSRLPFISLLPPLRPSGSFKVPEGTRSRYKVVLAQWSLPEGAELYWVTCLPLPPSQLQTEPSAAHVLSTTGRGGNRGHPDPGTVPSFPWSSGGWGRGRICCSSTSPGGMAQAGLTEQTPRRSS